VQPSGVPTSAASSHEGGTIGLHTSREALHTTPKFLISPVADGEILK
jgi:hypothetical protein